MKTILKQVLFLLFLIPALTWAQTKVSGTITDGLTGMPLGGVNVIIKDTSQGTSSDFDGNYTINLTNGQTLVFSFVGYTSREVVFAGQQKLDMTLLEDADLLDEVVLIGYGETTQQNATGAVSKVSSEEFNQGAIVAPEQLLAGKTAGVRITSGSGAPGGGSEIRIRGGASLSGNNSPLIVVDGLPLDQRGVQGVRNQLNAINPNEILDFVVLKDASATAIYGSRASNGVILITTKKGSANQPFKVEYDAKASQGKVFNKLDLLDANQFSEIINDTGSDPSISGTSSTDWQDAIYQTALGMIQNVTVSKGFENSNFRVNYNLTSQNGVLIGDHYERNAVNANYVQRLLDNNLKLTLTAKAIKDENKYANNGAIGNAKSFDPTHPVYNEDGSYFHYIGEALSPQNPVWLLNNDVNNADNRRVISNLNIDYKLPFLEGLKFNFNAGVDYSELEGLQTVTKDPRLDTNFAYRNEYSGMNRNVLMDFFFNYKKDVESINTIVDVTAGHSFQDFYLESNRSETDAGVMIERPMNIENNALESYFARASFDIADKYLVSLSYRRDGSSRFSEQNRWGAFPGASVGWKISNEDFMDNSFFSNLKLRAGWGVTGQQEIGPNYGYLGIYTPGQAGALVQFGDTFVNTLRPEEYDADLKWEETTQMNVALDFGLFNNRLTGSIDLYQRETDDLLATVPTPAGSNLSDLLTTNVGSMDSKGIEIGLSADIIDKEDLTWNVSANVTFEQREITKLSLGEDPDFFIPQGGIAGGVGNTIQLWKEGYDPSTFFVFRQVYDDAGQPIEGAYVDVNGDNQITEADKQAYKKATPDAFAGFTSLLTYKNLDFSFTFRGSFGNYMYNNVDSGSFQEGIINTAGNYYLNNSVNLLESNFNDAQYFSDYYIQRADFVKLDNVSLGYTFEGSKVDVRASITGTNLLIISDYDGLDPEISNGIDNNFYPRPRTYVVGLNFTF
jgi:iron complex outermembrane receptor protein